MSTKLKLYNVEDEYIEFLIKIDKRVFSNKEEDRVKERKYLGIVFKSINGFNYLVPLSSPKDSDYEKDKKDKKKFIFDENGRKIIRKSITPIMRIIAKDKDGYDELKGTLKFSNMIPIPDCALVDYDVDKEEDLDYKILVTKELSFIFSNSDKVIKNANLIYNQKTKNLAIKYLESTVDFLKLENACRNYESSKTIITKEAVVDTYENTITDGQAVD